MTARYALSEDYVDDGDLMLVAHGDLDGYAVVTEKALSDFVAVWADNDRNGTWGEVFACVEGPTPEATTLCMTKSDCEDPDDWEYFPRVPDKYRSHGQELFWLHGWQLIRVD
ncbi:hypothetical protein [Gordonia malaquae]|uniref:hypothetical protein n=1 Tax=Gordonia malaquae TaxID=410332 RepID=UPI003017C519